MFVKIFADGGLFAVLVLGAVAGGWWLTTKKPKLTVLAPYVVMAGLTSLTFGKFISLLPVGEERPFVTQGVSAGAAFINNPGFPSDHALLATVVTLAVLCLTPYKKIGLLMIVFVILMSVARVLALVHTPLDIVGGVTAGLVGAIWYKKLKHDTI